MILSENPQMFLRVSEGTTVTLFYYYSICINSNGSKWTNTIVFKLFNNLRFIHIRRSHRSLHNLRNGDRGDDARDDGRDLLRGGNSNYLNK
jgi:hypothetical protein